MPNTRSSNRQQQIGPTLSLAASSSKQCLEPMSLPPSPSASPVPSHYSLTNSSEVKAGSNFPFINELNFRFQNTLTDQDVDLDSRLLLMLAGGAMTATTPTFATLNHVPRLEDVLRQQGCYETNKGLEIRRESLKNLNLLVQQWIQSIRWWNLGMLSRLVH